MPLECSKPEPTFKHTIYFQIPKPTDFMHICTSEHLFELIVQLPEGTLIMPITGVSVADVICMPRHHLQVAGTVSKVCHGQPHMLTSRKPQTPHIQTTLMLMKQPVPTE